MRRVAFVVQRHGDDVDGGAELLCRTVAARMARHWSVEILTTTARDYRTWAPHYPAGVDDSGPVRVRRFDVDAPRDLARFDRWYARLATLLAWRERAGEPAAGLASRLKALARRLLLLTYDHVPGLAAWSERRFLRLQGPVSHGLTAYLDAHGDDHDLFVFVTYLYWTTVRGLPRVARRAALLPTAHDEPAIRLGLYRTLFASAAGLMFMTASERALVARLFPETAERPARVAGIGIDAPPAVDPQALARRLGLPGPYILYLGRIEPGKGCETLIEGFVRHRRARPESTLTLVLMGRAHMPLPERDDVHALGFVDDLVKHEGLAGARALVVPSPYESLSLSALEAWSHGTPVIANADCEVLAAHLDESGGGWGYRGPDALAETLATVTGDATEAGRRGAAGRAYVERRYGWATVEAAYLELAEELLG